MTKKKRAIGVILAIALILLVFLAGYSFAKYYTKVDGEGEGTIAKWSFIAGNSDGNIKEISLVDTANEVSLVSGKIAPGTKGDFDIVIDATGSEVGVNYEVKVLSETNLPANMKYYITKEDGSTSNEYSSLEDLAKVELKGDIPINQNQVKKVTVNWLWPYETEDTSKTEEYDLADLQAGTKSDFKYKFILQIIGTQTKNA